MSWVLFIVGLTFAFDAGSIEVKGTSAANAVIAVVMHLTGPSLMVIATLINFGIIKP